MSSNTLLEMRRITKEFPGVKALSEVSLVVGRPEIHAICGENGAGKSTLMKVLSGVYPAGSYDGDIVFDGQATYLKDSGTEKSLVAGETVAIRKLYESTPVLVQTTILGKAA